MATVYRYPDLVGPPPDFMPDYEAYGAACDAWCERLAEYCRTYGNGDLAGKRIAIPFADGGAEYMILSHKPTRLIHLPLGDAWSVPDYQTRGLRIADLRRMAY